MMEERVTTNARMDWWHEAKFGMFVHWGLYALPAGYWKGESVYGIGEWIMQNGRIPVADYAALAAEFNPTEFDAEKWVGIAKDAGMQYLVITAKHHDGFAMFASEASPFNIVDATPFGRDPLQEMAESCRRHGLRFGVYYSQAQDWHHPGGASKVGHWDPAQEGDMTAYVRDIAAPQVRELLTRYGPVSILFWDTPFAITPEQAALLAPLRALQPGLITNDRLGGGYGGDIETPEQFIPAAGSPGRHWEVCMTMNGTWGFRSDDQGWKSAEELLHNLIDIVSKGGNYLLNVGPDATGVIPAPSVERLAEIGAWMKAGGEAIYGADPSPFGRQLPWGRCTQKPGKLFLSVWDWPPDGVLSVPIRNTVHGAYLLSDPQAPLPTVHQQDAVEVQLPARSPDGLAPIVVLEIAGPADPAPPPALSQEADGAMRLTAENADFAADHVRWRVEVTRPGAFYAVLTYATDPNTVDEGYKLYAGDQTLPGSDPGKWAMQKTVSLGTVHIEAPGHIDLRLEPVSASRMAVLGVRELSLIPTDLPH